MKRLMKQLCLWTLILTMVLSGPTSAFAQVNHENLTDDKAKFVNSLTPVQIARPEKGKTAEDLIKNPEQPAIYTLRTDYKVQRGEKYKVNYQPYIASVGAGATADEQKKVNKHMDLPTIAGYKKPQENFTIDYDTVKKEADGKNKKGDATNGLRYSANKEFNYDSISNEIKIKHVFQKLDDFTKYTNPDGSVGDDTALFTTQNGNTGSTMQANPLSESDPRRKGFIPEAEYINMQVPENAKDFILEYRYNRAHYDVVYDTQGGTALPTRTLYYEQVIPKIADAPTKVGGVFQGWKPSVDLKTKDGKTFKANEIIKVGTGQAIKDLDAKLEMPASKVTFTAVWKDNEKADYAVQFWAEKADHADNASLLEKYEYMGTHVYKDADTGTRPNLDTVSIDKIQFPDLDQARLEKIWAGDKFYGDKYLYLNKFFVYNKDLTHDQNKDSKNVNLVKSVDSTGRTVYNIYYDRQAYDLYFTKSNALGDKETFYPSIYVPDGDGGAELAGGPGNPYHYTARFNQLMLGWPNDAMQTKGFNKGKQSYGWGPNYGYPQWPLHLDTPPYRLNADEFLDMKDYDNWGGYVSKIDKGDGTYIDVNNEPRYKDAPYKALSFGIKQESGSMPHHMDFWMDGFKDGETIIRYDLYRSKADTNSLTYGHRYSKVQGFTPYGTTIEEGSEENGRITEDDIDALNEERGEITPYPDKEYTDTFGFNNKVGQMHFRPAFFNTADGFGDPLEGVTPFKENGYIRFKYHRNKYPLRFNYDPSKIKGDNEFGSTNSLDTFYEFPLKVLSPDLVPNDTPRADRDYFKDNPANFLDNPENLKELGLTDLVFNDANDKNKLKVKRPDNLSDQMVFKGWALDPAGTKLIWENPKETMPTHPVHLFAKWGEPDYQWKVTFDPNGGALSSIDEAKVTQKRKTIQVGDKGQEETKTFAQKEKNDGDKQVFTVIQRQKLVEPAKPTKKGYNFMGWEVIHYKKDANTGDYTNEIDNSYRETYKVPELYSFGNDVVSPVYLKAIWVPNDRVDVDVVHHIMSLDLSKETKTIPETLHNKRPGYLVATSGDKQNEEYILASHKELEEKLPDELKKLYKEYNDRVKANNTFFQTFKVEPEKIPDPNDSSKMIDNPKAKDNVFHFFYRPFRTRDYNVNYIDERFKAEVEKFFKGLNLTDINKLMEGEEYKNADDKGKEAILLAANEGNKEKFEAKREAFEELIKEYKIVDPEAVSNGNRHYDARNYRQIPGWVLAKDEKPQQQLFFDVNEDTNAFLGINGTGADQVFFYYKDVRVIETKKDDPVPDGYVRVTFKIDDKHKGGVFKDKDGKEVTELHYDVIKGLKSNNLPHPVIWEGGMDAQGNEKKKEANRYYITPDQGKTFKGWDNEKWLNEETEINKNYTFTAYFDWSGLTSSGLVRTEAFKDPNGKWTNDFAPKLEDLKKQLVWKEKDKVTTIPEGTDIKFIYKNDAGKETEIKTDEDLFNLVKEMNAEDKDQTVRVLDIVAKVTFKDGDATKPQELPIPVTVYKNRYEALNEKGDKPKYLSDAEKLPAEKGGLKDYLSDTESKAYVKVTVSPTKDLKSKDTKVYYVNPKAWVVIPEIDTKDNSRFTNWTADKDAQNEKGKKGGIFDFTKRHKFTEDTIITPGFAGDVVEQEKGKDKPNVPESYVKVIVRTTDKAKDESQFERTFWVNPTTEVAIDAPKPEGKTDQEVDLPKIGKKRVNYVFNQWQKVQAGEKDDSLTKVDPAVKIDLAKNKYTDKVTVIEASYFERFAATPILKPIKVEKLDTPEGKEITEKDLIEKITPREGKEIESITVVQKPDPNNPGQQEAKVTIKYKDGSTEGTADKPIVIPVEVHKNIIPETADGKKPSDAMDNYVKVTFTAGEGGKLNKTLTGNFTYYVSPEVEVDMNATANDITATPFTGYTANGAKWENEDGKKLKDTFTKDETVFKLNLVKSDDIVEKTNDPNQVIPKGYVTVKFIAGEHGSIVGGDKTYYVNPDAKIKLVEKATEGATNELVVPATKANDNYVFEKWVETIDYANPIKGDREHVANFTLGQVTLTYEAGEGAKGDVPAIQTATYGGTVQLAGQGNLTKENSEFIGWKLDGEEKIYQPDDSVKLEKARTATAQWELVKHKVTFDTMGGSDVPEQKIQHGGKLVKDKVTDPTKDGFVFMGWKENASDENYFDLTTPITADKTLVAQWEKSVQPIKEDTTVDENLFIKVTFNKGKHGVLVPEKNKTADTVTYKVAKADTFEDAVKHGLVVPGIEPAKYYKVAEDQPGVPAKHGWDKELNLTLEANETEKVFIAQYELEANVVPVDPEKDNEVLKQEKPEEMVLVVFKVDPNKAFMTGDTKFYVKKSELVNIKAPVVHPLTLDNGQVNDYEFKGWSLVTNDSTKQVSFTDDTTIKDSPAEKPDIRIRNPRPNAKMIFIQELTDGATGHLEVISGNQRATITSSKRGTRNVFELKTLDGSCVKKNDLIRFYAEKDGIKSDVREYRVK